MRTAPGRPVTVRGPHPSPAWGSWSVPLLHWVRPTMATILAPRLLRRFLAVVVPVPSPACWGPQISPLMLELRTTFLEAAAEAGTGSPLNMIHGAAGPQATLWGSGRDKGIPRQTLGPSTAAPPLPSCVTSGKALSLSEVVGIK